MNILYLPKIFSKEEVLDFMCEAYDIIKDEILFCPGYNFRGLYDDNLNLIIPRDKFENSHIVEAINLDGGDFPLLVNMYPRGELNNDEVYTNLIIARKIAKYKNVDIVISDNTADPYQYWLISPNGQLTVVGVERDKIDSEYQIVINDHREGDSISQP